MAAGHRASVLSGEGAQLHGGRWNPIGTPAVYAAGSLSLAALELLVHLRIEEARKRYVALTLEWRGSVASGYVRLTGLPEGWRAGEIPAWLQQLGRR
ncbi:MAG: RES domain-containing protein, partial [Nitrococcus sp.]|nr:RES domain-containing protein [Nitrococcus sp.]